MTNPIDSCSEPQKDIIHSSYPVNLFMAGQGGGKTHTAGIVSYSLITEFKLSVGLIAANTHEQLNRSTLNRVMQVWRDAFGCREWNEKTKEGHYTIGKRPPNHWNTEHHAFKDYHNIISFSWGAVIYVGSLENYKALDGIEIDWAILDETKDTKETAVKEVIVGRLRGKAMPFNPLYIFTSPAKVPWINEWFSLDKHIDEINAKIHSSTTYFRKAIGNKFVTISSTYHNQKNLPPDYITNQMANLHAGLQEMLIFGNPFSKAGGEIYKAYSRQRQVGRFPYNPDLPVFAWFDFNVNPYMTCRIWQIDTDLGTGVRRCFNVKEFCPKNPDNSTPKIGQIVSKWLRTVGHKSGLFIGGDPAGRSEDTRSEKGQNDFTILMKELTEFKPTLKVDVKAPPVVMRINWISTIHERTNQPDIEPFQKIEIYFDESCVNGINDYTYLKEASDGTKLKEKYTDPETNVTYEKYGHCSDADDYFFAMVFSKEFSEYVSGPSRQHAARIHKVFPSMKH
jgi:hypothetical protein